MILKIYLYLCLNHVFMVVCAKIKCTHNSNGVCKFENVTKTESDRYFEPTAANPEEVTEVRFGNSTLEVFTNELCKAFPNLKEISAYYLGINRITETAFKNCKHLTGAWFHDNKIKELPDELFKNNLKLKLVYFSDNLIKNFNPKIFLNARNVRYIDFGGNYITDFPANELPELKDLDELHIENNEIVDIDEKEILNKFPKLKSIYLNNNPFDCGRLEVIIDEFTKRNVAIDYTYIEKRDREYYLNRIGNAHCLARNNHTEWLSKEVNELLDNLNSVKDMADKFNLSIAKKENIEKIAKRKISEQKTEIEDLKKILQNEKERKQMLMIIMFVIIVSLLGIGLKKVYDKVSSNAE